MDCGFCFFVCNRTPRRLLVCCVSCPACHRAPRRSSDCGWLSSCLVYRGTPGMPSNCVVFRGVHKLVISCSIVLCAADLLGGLWLWCQRLKQTDLLGCLRIWFLQESRLASQAEITRQKVDFFFFLINL